jgi:hypothetical protein
VTVTDPAPTYDGSPHSATAVAKGVGGANVSGNFTFTYDGSATAPTNAKTSYAVVATFTSTDPNYTGATGIGTLTINKAPSVTVIGTGYTSIYDGLPHGVSASVTGVGGLNQSVPVSYNPGASTTPVNPGTYTATATYAGDANHLGSNAGPVTINISFGACSPAIGAGGVILPPINSDGTSVYQRKGGSTIPVKFNVCGANGAPLTDPALVFAGTGGALTMTGAMRGTITVVNESATNDIPDTAFTWDGQQWHFNMATTNLSSATTYTFRINLAYAPASIQFVVGVK